jgi:hypothetical protein
VKLTADFNVMFEVKKNVEVYLHSSTDFHGVVLHEIQEHHDLYISY